VLLSDRIVMMSNGPAATVGEILDIDLERPRNRLALADNPAYNRYRAEVLRFLHERHAQPEAPVTPKNTPAQKIKLKPALKVAAG
ncbi:MAG TPA: ABC transporter ATP-binding protein, partial [Gammaproteobacteria bacterium]